MTQTKNGYEPKYSNQELSCRDLTSDQCRDLRNHSISNDPREVFLGVRSLEEKYRYLLKEARDEWEEKIKTAQEKIDRYYQEEVTKYAKKLDNEFALRQTEMEHAMKALEKQEQMILAEIDVIYQRNRQKLLNQTFKLLDLDFCIVKSTDKKSKSEGITDENKGN